MAGLYIPNDWNGTDYRTLVIEIPDSAYWRATVKGSIWNLAQPEAWDSDTGDPDAAAQIGAAVYDSARYTVDGGSA